MNTNSTSNLSLDIRSIWTKLLTTNPSLKSIEYIFDSEDASQMQFIPGPPPKLYFPENADLNIFQTFLTSRPISCELVCQKLGIDVSKLTPEFLRAFIFLHECGHAYDFVENFANDSSVEHPENVKDRFEAACMRCNERQDYELKKLPIPVTPSGFLASRREYPQFLEQLLREYLKKETVSDEDYTRVFEELEHAYKDLPSEKYADEFAVKYLRLNNLY